MSAVPVPPRLPTDEQLLARAGDLIAHGWCQHGLAQDERGREVEPWSAAACRWSPLGALLAAWQERGGEAADDFAAAYRALALATGGHIVEWNAARWRTERHVRNAFTHAREYLSETRGDDR